MQKFWELFEQSIIMQSTLTIIVIAAYLYMVVTGQTVPPQLSDLVGLVIGFFFGSKIGAAQGFRQAATKLSAFADNHKKGS